MGLKAILDTLDDVPAELHEHYTETKQKDSTTKFVLDLEGIDDHPKVRGVVTANRANIEKRDEYKKKLAEAETKLAELPDDFDVEEYLELKAAAVEDPNDPEKKKQRDAHLQSQREVFEKRIENMQKQHAEAIAAKDAELAERDGYIDKSVVDTQLKDALLESGVNPDLIEGALATLKPSVKVAKDDSGNRKPIVETDMGEVDVKSFVKDWASTKGKPYLAKAEGPSPKGQGGKTSAAGKTMTRAQFEALDPAAQATAMTKEKVTLVDG
ncbi:hypothetical protein [Parvibaculum sp.]|uniref:hypothetical protein n=1 Tax=Parvibaculum sp. TaxID=2024848 RepID=UPI001D2CD711|nr:hypothetical protein [Parvibaculum sp.]MBX3490896.1 hypothetical protein [Parvibaculum sp.]